MRYKPRVSLAQISKKALCPHNSDFAPLTRIAQIRSEITFISNKLDIENPIIRINTAFKGCSSLEKISVLPRIYHN